MKDVKIIKTTKEDIQKFEDPEWEKMDLAHYGKKNIPWSKRHFVFKATENGETVGAITGNVELGVIYIATLIVKDSKRGGGIGSSLIQAAIDFGKKLKAHKAWLVTGIDWQENIFYQKLGFNKTGILSRHYVEHDFAVYEKFV